jgi:hypothetical protein
MLAPYMPWNAHEKHPHFRQKLRKESQLSNLPLNFRVVDYIPGPSWLILLEQPSISLSTLSAARGNFQRGIKKTTLDGHTYIYGDVSSLAFARSRHVSQGNNQ